MLTSASMRPYVKSTIVLYLTLSGLCIVGLGLWWVALRCSVTWTCATVVIFWVAVVAQMWPRIWGAKPHVDASSGGTAREESVV